MALPFSSSSQVLPSWSRDYTCSSHRRSRLYWFSCCIASFERFISCDYSGLSFNCILRICIACVYIWTRFSEKLYCFFNRTISLAEILVLSKFYKNYSLNLTDFNSYMLTWGMQKLYPKHKKTDTANELLNVANKHDIPILFP